MNPSIISDPERFGIHIINSQIIIDDKYITIDNILEYIKLVYPDIYKTLQQRIIL